MNTWQLGFYFVGLSVVTFTVSAVIGYTVHRIVTVAISRMNPERNVTDL
jgi:hypothetical protein